MKTGMPVVLVNPSRRRKRKNPRRAKRRAKRRNPSRAKRRNPYGRRRNPTSKGFGGALVSSLMGGLGGLLSYGIHFGAAYAPIGNIGQTLILTGAGTLASMGVAAWADERAAAGLMGGTVALVTGRIHAQLALGAFVKKQAAAQNGNGTTTQASGVMRRLNAGKSVPAFTGPLRPAAAAGAGKVVPRTTSQAAGAGAMLAPGGSIAPPVAASRAPMGFAGGSSFRVPVGAGAGRRLMGPRAWSYAAGAGAGRVYVSAHDVPRNRTT